MTDSEIKAAFASLHATHPVMLALTALAENAVKLETAASAQPTLSDGDRHFNAGRLAHALDFQQTLTDLLNQTVEQREEGDGKPD